MVVRRAESGPVTRVIGSGASHTRLAESSILTRYLGQLKELQKTYPHSALKNPTDRDAFEFGKHCGVLEGLERAERLLLEAQSESDDEGE